jgi:hypothetical protein
MELTGGPRDSAQRCLRGVRVERPVRRHIHLGFDVGVPERLLSK